MIDWVTARLRCTHDSSKLFGGLVVSMNAKGEVEWQTEKRVVVEGSYSKYITVRSHTDGVIEVSGNPAKFLQGHNVFGSDDLIHLVTKTLDRLIALDIGLTPTEEEKQALLGALHADGKDWDADNKQIVDYKWKPKIGDNYYYIDLFLDVIDDIWSDDRMDALVYTSGNCFKTKEEAQKYADKFTEILKCRKL